MTTADVAERLLSPRRTLLGSASGDSLQNLIADQLKTGALCWVIDQGCPYYFDRDSMAAVSAPNVIATGRGASAPGRWFRFEGGGGGGVTINAVSAFATQEFWDDFTQSPVRVWTANDPGPLVIDEVELETGDIIATSYVGSETRYPIGVVVNAGSDEEEAVVSFVEQPETPYYFSVTGGEVYAGTLWVWPANNASVDVFMTEGNYEARLLPPYSVDDNGSVLTIVDGEPTWVP